ncbi:MAG: hypothetical protein KC777_17960 [Cyanobacteria bacterium HKST-UBA02]|nr:hypothetical protein [Cyanobacteria bacterium HKST-UBA02]
MSRFVVLRRTGLAAASETPDNWHQRLAKFVPGDILILFTTGVTSLVSVKIDPQFAPMVAAGMMLLVAFGVAWNMAQQAPEGKVRLLQTVMSPLAFLALAYPIASPLLGSYFVAWIGVLAQFMVTLITLIWCPEEG